MKEIHDNIGAQIVLASENPHGQKLVTAVLRYPRFLHSELMTHRAFSRNAASSRAIPVHKMREMIKQAPATPEYWGADKPGMQPGEVLAQEELDEVKFIWNTMKDVALMGSDALRARHLNKGLANRVLEPWMPYTVLVSATSWDNFFALRAHKDALPEFQILAYRMLDAYMKAQFQRLEWGEWHIPFGDQMPEGLSEDDRIRVAVARAARISYLTFDGEMSVEKDLKLYHQLMVAEPLHASPAEHVARAMPHLWLNTEFDHPSEFHCDVGKSRDTSSANSWPLPYDVNMVHQGNFQGFTQYRKMQQNECVHKADLAAIMAGKPDWITLPGERRFYKNTYETVVLSESPDEVRLEELPGSVEVGADCLFSYDLKTSDAVTGREMADLLYDAGSHPGFFRLNDDGTPTGSEVLDSDQGSSDKSS